MNHLEDFDDLDAGIDLTPIIDVLFLLLIFFIMTATFSKPVVDLTLPKADSSTAASRQKQLLITVDRIGNIYFKGQQIPANTINIDQIMNMDTELPINFQIDSQAPFEKFMLLIDRARIKGRSNFTVTTSQEIQKK